jgi:hypothetical protein
MASELIKESFIDLKFGACGYKKEIRDAAKKWNANFIREVPGSEIFTSCSIKNIFRYRKVRSLKYNCNNYLLNVFLGQEIWKKKTS